MGYRRGASRFSNTRVFEVEWMVFDGNSFRSKVPDKRQLYRYYTDADNVNREGEKLSHTRRFAVTKTATEDDT